MSESIERSYKLLKDFEFDKERISPVIPLPIEGKQIGASVMEREYEGSGSYAIFVYDLNPDNLFGAEGSKVKLLGGGETPAELLRIFFSVSPGPNYERVCELVEQAVEDYRANNLEACLV